MTILLLISIYSAYRGLGFILVSHFFGKSSSVLVAPPRTVRMLDRSSY
jgi:hypothetical protein